MAGFLDEGAGWLVRYGGASFAWVKVAGFLLLQGSLALLIAISLWSVFSGSQENYEDEDFLDDDIGIESQGDAGGSREPIP